MGKLLQELEGKSNRKAQFRTSIALILDDVPYTFEGKVEGQILGARTGEQGFGYDPIFQPDGFTTSFAEMSMSEKNKISHRGRAIAAMIHFLKQSVKGKR
jgi:XTP/dITP diphosphohydrolase